MITSAEEFAKLRLSEDPAEYERAANDAAPLEVWRDVAARYPELRFWIAQNKTVPLEMLIALSSDSDATVRSMVARKRRLPADLQRQLAADIDPTVRAALARNANITEEVRDVLATDVEPLVAESASAVRNGG